MFVLGPSEYSNWPATDQEIDIFKPGLMIIPKVFAIKFNPIASDSNLETLFLSKSSKIGYIRAKSIKDLESIINSGDMNRCPYNGCIACRYISVSRRESNALRQGVT